MPGFKIIKSNRKTLALHITNQGELIVKAPISCPKQLILDFVNSKQKWIEQKQENVKKRLEAVSDNSLKPGRKTPYLGEFYEIIIDNGIRQPVIFDNKFIFKSEEIIKYSLLKWYRIEALNIIPGIAETEARKFGFDIADIKINSAKTRWGSCTSKKNINFSWRLVLLPEKIIHYVVIHELAHLVEMNHSKKYWSIVEKLMPDYKTFEKWLKKNSYKYTVNL